MTASDRTYLLREQYPNPVNLQTRMALHQRFGQNPYPFARWVFDHLELPARAQVLELGGGTGSFWRDNQDRIAADWRVLVSDFSPGMLERARQQLQSHLPAFTFAVIDAHTLPLSDQV